MASGLIKGKTRAPGIPKLPIEKVEEILTLTMTGKPAAATHWSCRTMARQVGVSRMSVNRVWREHALKPHQVKGFKVSNDPLFAEKLRDVIGLYLNPPEKAGTMTHDYKRHGTTTLFAALNVHEELSLANACRGIATMNFSNS